MVCYCCVKGCTNNSKMKKKDPDSTISFHAFPNKPEIKLKWLKAIGRPNWEPRSHARICSAHFNYDQLNRDNFRIRIKEDACPVNSLPLNSNFEASDLEVCRICLATDVNMNNLQKGILKSCMESIGGLNESHNIEGLPQFVCNECAAHLVKFYHVVEKSIVAQATMLDIFAQHGQITKALIRGLNRKQLNLVSSVNYYKQNNIYDYTYDYEKGTSCLVSSKCNTSNECNNIHIKENNFFMNENYYQADIEDGLRKCIDPKLHIKNKDAIDSKNDNNAPIERVVHVDDDEIIALKEEGIDDESLWEDCNEEIVVKVKYKHKKNKISTEEKSKKKKPKSVDGLTPDEVKMQEYFTIVKLSLQEQIDEWKKSVAQRHLTSETTYQCETCSKVFANVNTHRLHISSHNPARGKAECPVCKLRFKNEVLVKSHRNRTHGKKFYCKSCPKHFNNVAVAKIHHRWHIGQVYACAACSFTSAHESSLRAHARSAHAHGRANSCVLCGRACLSARGLLLHYAMAHRDRQKTEGNPAFRCEQCGINFVSEGARRVHILTSSQHKQKPTLLDTSQEDPSLKRTCSKCGVEFGSLKELIIHTRSEHRRPAKTKTRWSLPGDSYPTQCEHCGEMVNSRKEHWWHVRKEHPNEKHTYQPVITAICEICGKGFQNSTKLQLHELRHAQPRVSCARCPRVFYDKYALARHASLHAAGPRAHACRACGRAFRLRASLQRHARVHTSARPYECTMCGKKFKYSTGVKLHVRTVHYKLPHPPRKKRTRARNFSTDANNDNN